MYGGACSPWWRTSPRVRARPASPRGVALAALWGGACRRKAPGSSEPWALAAGTLSQTCTAASELFGSRSPAPKIPRRGASHEGIPACRCAVFNLSALQLITTVHRRSATAPFRCASPTLCALAHGARGRCPQPPSTAAQNKLRHVTVAGDTQRPSHVKRPRAACVVVHASCSPRARLVLATLTAPAPLLHALGALVTPPAS
jgi:hypothetical protein